MDEKKKIIISIHHDDILFLVAFFSTKVFFCGGGQIKLEKIGSLFKKKSHRSRSSDLVSSTSTDLRLSYRLELVSSEAHDDERCCYHDKSCHLDHVCDDVR